MTITRRHYTKEEKLMIVNESFEPGADVNLISKKSNIHPNTLWIWRKDYTVYENNAFPGHGNKLLTDQEREREILDLKKKLKESELQNEILKKAVGIFSSPNKTS